MPTWQYFLTKVTDSRRKFGSYKNGSPNYGREVVDFFLIKKSNFDKILAVRLEGLFWAMNKVGCSFFLWTLGLAFEGFTLCSAEGSNSYILLVIFKKVCPFNPTASRLGRP
jgi:hypothetical protein